MSTVKGILTIAQGVSQSDVFDKKEWALGMTVRLPSGFQGVLGIRVSEEKDGTFDPIYDDTNTLIQIDPTSFTLPAWFVLKADIMPAHFVRFQSFTDITEATPQNQDVARTLKVMGTS